MPIVSEEASLRALEALGQDRTAELQGDWTEQVICEDLPTHINKVIHTRTERNGGMAIRIEWIRNFGKWIEQLPPDFDLAPTQEDC